MEIVINEYGTFLGKKGKRFILEGKETLEIPSSFVEKIILVVSCSLSSEALKMAVESGIDIVLLNEYGDPIARLQSCNENGHVQLRKKQLELSISNESIKISKKFIVSKISNQYNLLDRILRNNEIELPQLESINEMLRNLSSSEGDRNLTKGILLGIEGNASRLYFDAIKLLIPDWMEFKGRTRNPPRDPFNAMLSYGYGILYNDIERGIVLSGMDPYIGFLHSDKKERMSLVYDLAEEFRSYLVDRICLTIVRRKEIYREDFDYGDGSVLLNKEGKRKIITAYKKNFASKINYEGNEVETGELIILQIKKLIKYLNEDLEYKPFILRW
ncbi:MAG TPA: CRISPR-associated endonuclease Cas1 [Methanofastidiosum sp.]|jgi:CRISPR-associated protein Cas1|nr:CRISPR-associated endonuclease Cas1 [Methanofastidiosum sp.]